MWVRFEASSTTSDVVNRWMQMNTMAQPGQTAVTPCEAKKWQHVAIVFDGAATSLYLDGEQVVQKSAPRNTVTFKYFALLPQPSYCNTTISFSEVRLWNVARTSTQLKNNVNNVDPKSEGLLGYWKMNEGTVTRSKTPRATAIPPNANIRLPATCGTRSLTALRPDWNGRPTWTICSFASFVLFC